jgi:hypothetical protein
MRVFCSFIVLDTSDRIARAGEDTRPMWINQSRDAVGCRIVGEDGNGNGGVLFGICSTPASG